jgi:cell division septation protein DedD
MNLIRLLIVALAVMLLAAGCSDKKEQAQQLEDQMLNQEPAQDTTADTVQAPAETTEVENQVGAGAVPQEEMTRESELPTAPASSGFTVQVASCPDRDYAEYLVDLYRGRGYDPFISEATVDGLRYYRVRVGAFDSYEGARAMQKDLLNRFSVDGWIDQIGD